MGKWVILLLVAIVVLAIVGFLIDVARAVAGVAIVILLAVVVVNWITSRNKR